MLIFISGQVFPFKVLKSIPLRLYRSWEARSKERHWVLNLFIASIIHFLTTGSVSHSHTNPWTFFFSTTVLLMCPCLNWIYLENVHRVYLYFRASRISDTTFGSHVVRDLAINTSINYGLASAKIFSLVCFLYPNIKQIRLNHVDCVGNMVRTDAVGS